MLARSCSVALARAVVVVGHHRAAAEALLGDLGPAHARRPQRLDPGAVDARRQEDLVVDLAQRRLVGRVVDVAASGSRPRCAARCPGRAARRGSPGSSGCTGWLRGIIFSKLALSVSFVAASSASSSGDDGADQHHRAAVVEDQRARAASRSCGSNCSRRRRRPIGAAVPACMAVSFVRPRSRCCTPRGPASTSTPAPALGHRGGRASAARPCSGAKLAPSSLLASTCPAWLTMHDAAALVERAGGQAHAARRWARSASCAPPSVLRTTLPRRPWPTTTRARCRPRRTACPGRAASARRSGRCRGRASAPGPARRRCNSSPPMRRTAYRCRLFGLSAACSSGSQVLPPSAVRSTRPKAPTTIAVARRRRTRRRATGSRRPAPRSACASASHFGVAAARVVVRDQHVAEAAAVELARPGAAGVGAVQHHAVVADGPAVRRRREAHRHQVGADRHVGLLPGLAGVVAAAARGRAGRRRRGACRRGPAR